MNLPKLRLLFDKSLARIEANGLPRETAIDHLILDVKECIPRGTRMRDPATPKGQPDPAKVAHRRRALAAAKAFAADEARKAARHQQSTTQEGTHNHAIHDR